MPIVSAVGTKMAPHFRLCLAQWAVVYASRVMEPYVEPEGGRVLDVLPDLGRARLDRVDTVDSAVPGRDDASRREATITFMCSFDNHLHHFCSLML